MLLPFPWVQGEHACVIGETGTGKTTLVSHLLLARKNTIACRTKDDDTPLPGRRIRSVREIGKYVRDDRFLLEPDFGDKQKQRDEMARMFIYTWDKSDTKGGWTVYIDEARYFDRILKLGDYLDRAANQGRSKNLTSVFGMQRPVGQERSMISEARHVITFSLDGRDARTFGEATMDSLRPHVQSLGQFEFLWYYRPRRQFAIGTFDPRRKLITMLPTRV